MYLNVLHVLTMPTVIHSWNSATNTQIVFIQHCDGTMIKHEFTCANVPLVVTVHSSGTETAIEASLPRN